MMFSLGAFVPYLVLAMIKARFEPASRNAASPIWWANADQMLILRGEEFCFYFKNKCLEIAVRGTPGFPKKHRQNGRQASRGMHPLLAEALSKYL
jgi:hypothetical protein